MARLSGRLTGKEFRVQIPAAIKISVFGNSFKNIILCFEMGNSQTLFVCFLTSTGKWMFLLDRHWLSSNLGSILSNYFCHKWTAIKLWQDFDCIVWDAQWVFKRTYLCLLLRIKTLPIWWFKFTDANPYSTYQNNASKLSVFFTAVVLRPNWVYSIAQHFNLSHLLYTETSWAETRIDDDGFRQAWFKAPESTFDPLSQMCWSNW